MREERRVSINSSGMVKMKKAVSGARARVHNYPAEPLNIVDSRRLIRFLRDSRPFIAPRIAARSRVPTPPPLLLGAGPGVPTFTCATDVAIPPVRQSVT